MRLLLLDDDVDEANEIKRFLGREGLAVDLAATPDAALISLEDAPPDIVLLTLWRPPLIGLELGAEVARRCPSALRLMLFSRSELNAAIQLAREDEPLRFLMRPWTEAQFVALLWRFISDQRLLQLVGERPAQGLSLQALTQELPIDRVVKPFYLPLPVPIFSPATVGGTLVRQRGIARLVTERTDQRRVVVEVPCDRARHPERALA